LQSFGLDPKQRGGGWIRLHDLFVGRVDDQDSFPGQLKKKSIALFGVPDACVFPLDPLLGLGQALLHGRKRTKIATNGQNAPVGAKSHRIIANRDLNTLARRVVDLSPAGRRPVRRLTQQLLDLWPAVGRNSVQPAAPDPILADRFGQSRFAKRPVDDNPLAIEDEGDVCG
jgi:hypothetical protein